MVITAWSLRVAGEGEAFLKRLEAGHVLDIKKVPHRDFPTLHRRSREEFGCRTFIVIRLFLMYKSQGVNLP